MTNFTTLCGTLATLCATLNNVPTEEVVAQLSYETVDSKEHLVELVSEGMNPYATRDLISDEMHEFFSGYLEYQKEQERLAELERQRIAEEQARLEEQRRQEELARKRAMEYSHKNYRQTYYSVQEGETNLGAGYNMYSSQVRVIDNVMNFYDQEYGYLPIVAININEVLASGLNHRGTPNLYGSVIQMKYPNGKVQKAIVLDACGACSRAKKIDLWVYYNAPSLDISNVEFKYIRKGW